MAPFSEFIDIHNHILPGVDDGPKNFEESAAMARCYADVGIHTVIATPHYIAGTAWAAKAERVLERLGELKRYLDQQQIPLAIHAGMEIAYHPNLIDRLQKGQLLPLAASDYYLLEPSFHGTQENLLHSVKSLLKMGKKVILAHAERIESFQKDIDPLLRLVERGLEIQLNMGSLLDEFDVQCKKTGLKLLDSECAHYLASDAHSATRRRPPTASDWNTLEKILGDELLTRLCITNPANLLATGITPPQ